MKHSNLVSQQWFWWLALCFFSSLLLSDIHKSFLSPFFPMCVKCDSFQYSWVLLESRLFKLPPHLLWNWILINVTHKPNWLNGAMTNSYSWICLGVSIIFSNFSLNWALLLLSLLMERLKENYTGSKLLKHIWGLNSKPFDQH